MITFITVIVLVVILYRRNRGSDRHLALFSGVFVTIQLLEFFLWLSIEQKRQAGSKKMNALVTRLVLLALWAQPLINSYMAFRDRSHFTSSNKDQKRDSADFFDGADSNPLFNNTVKYLMFFMVIIFIVLMVIALRNASEPGSKFKTTPGPNCHLIWKRKNAAGRRFTGGNGFLANHKYQSYLYMIGLFLPVLLIRPLKKGLILALLGAVLLIISRRMSNREEFSSWWCWIAGIFVVAALLLRDPTVSKETNSSDSPTPN